MDTNLYYVRLEIDRLNKINAELLEVCKEVLSSPWLPSGGKLETKLKAVIVKTEASS
ncbi:MAG: hypothetical protein OK457_00680 [Thaumarchaeota archaeon]|nr:hypothetical protein [Nitrososphaerota archaeon]